MTLVERVREKNPLIHHITNQVVMNFTANGLLAYGGSPIMAKEVKEVANMAEISSGILINIGTLTEDELEAMMVTGQAANKHNIPILLDPVGVAATPFRTEAVKALLAKINFTAIKGNAGEIAHLAEVPWETKGVESVDGDEKQLIDIAKIVARKYKTTVIITGETDIITNGEELRLNKTGHEMLTKITGAGCLLGSIAIATIAVAKNTVEGAYEAVQFYGLAAERAINQPSTNGPGTFIPNFIDELQR